jgi:hypothetical protein
MANNQQNLTALERVNRAQISGTQALATNDLMLAGAALTGQQATTKRSAAVASPLARRQSAAGYVNAAGAIDVGTAVQVSGRTVAAVPLARGQDLDIAGGAGPFKSVPAVAVARQDAVSAVLKHAGGGGGGSLQQQAADGLQPGSVDELSEVDRLRALYHAESEQHLPVACGCRHWRG